MSDSDDKAPYDPRVPPELRPITQMIQIAKELQTAGQTPPHISINLQLLNPYELEQIAILLKKLREPKDNV